MKKNVSGQKVGAQLINATTGAAFTGSVTVSVTGDAGTQATGSVGSGACTHEGNGYHTYAPAQAETNYDLVAYTFTGTGAIPATVQVYPSFPQTADVASGVAVNSIANDAITAAAIADNAIDANAIASNAISAGKIATGAITSAKFAAGAIDAAALANDAGDDIATRFWLNATSTQLAADASSANAEAQAAAIDAALVEGRLTATRAGYLDNLSAGAVATASAVSTVSSAITRLLGLAHDNAMVDECVYSSGKLTSSRIRVFANAAALAAAAPGEADGADSEIARYVTAAAYSGDDLISYELTRQL